MTNDVKILEMVLSGVRFKGAHYVFESDKRMPRLVIDLFSKGNGIVIKVGDASHPSGVEVITTYPDWAERNERMLEDIGALIRDGLYEKDCPKKPDYVT